MRGRRPAPAFRLRIGHLDVAVLPMSDRVAEREECEGMYDPSTDSIYIRKNTSTTEQVRILMHEWLHSLFDSQGIGEIPLPQEAICGTVDRGITNLFLHNPHLLPMLLEALGPEAKPLL